ncbi:hypothetical protein DPEC_G00218550 [Dallia pectoralis]|uniref:Uncharacterized protein n=1 Tax=Dallia pectoralis TaxID=75939 RepID=A0ACC2G396_DALPE|nr:hypothetical protein DPEC_G00218550 [Dallia pectoralis]
MKFNPVAEYIPEKNLIVPDVLSRHPEPKVDDTGLSEDVQAYVDAIEELEKPKTVLEHIKAETEKDETMQKLNIVIERAHRALTAKPKIPEAAPRSLVVRFLDFSVKEIILRQAWEQKKVMHEGNQIYFDHDFFPELQKKRALVREAVKQLKMKNSRAKCVFPAQLRVFMEDGTKTYPTLTDAKLVLEELGVHARVGERERLETELCRGRWNAAGRRVNGGP